MKIDIPTLQAEYESYVAQATNKNSELDWHKLTKLLESSGDWTSLGSDAIIYLVQQYGAFVLKNALALALATNIEDGDLGL
jgi:hypothetical protein